MDFMQSAPLWKVTQIKQRLCGPFSLHPFFSVHVFLHPCLLSQIAPLSGSGDTGGQYGAFEQTPLTETVPFRGFKAPPLVSIVWELSLCWSPSVLWPQSRRMEMQMWPYECKRGKDCPAFCGQDARGVGRMPAGWVKCAHTVDWKPSPGVPTVSAPRQSRPWGAVPRSGFERQLDIPIMPCKCMHLYNASGYSDSRDKPRVS